MFEISGRKLDCKTISLIAREGEPPEDRLEFGGTLLDTHFEKSSCIDDHTVVLFQEGEDFSALAVGNSGFRFLLLSGKPLCEAIAWQGPIIMNTQEKLRTAFPEYRNGTFIKHPRPSLWTSGT